MSIQFVVGSGAADPTAVPALPWPTQLSQPPEYAVTFRSMACDVTIRAVRPGPGARAAVERARSVFERVESACTRFKPNSPLMLANADGGWWCAVPRECFAAVSEAARAHVETGGLFDPRVLTALTKLGYDRSLNFSAEPIKDLDGEHRAGPTPAPLGSVSAEPWRPGLDEGGRAIQIGPHPIDLGGIGKGLAVRWAARELAGIAGAFLVEAGGDCYLAGSGPDGEGWHVAVEDPRGGLEPLVVLSLSDAACATSSTRVRRWQSQGRMVHHLIDPATGTSAAGGLLAVTVVGPDPAWAEVWSKSLFVAGADQIAQISRREELAALWIGEDGEFQMSPAMDRHLIWSAPQPDLQGERR